MESLKIRRATEADKGQIAAIYAKAVSYMQANGNPTQWQGGYPSTEVIDEDMNLDRLYVLEDSSSNIVAQFCYFVGDDPTYSYIDGAWLDDAPYGVVHRLASSGEVKGAGKICLDWCFEQHPNMRIDTHADNKTMLHIIRSSGFVECGEIIVKNGTRRIAFQRR